MRARCIFFAVASVASVAFAPRAALAQAPPEPPPRDVVAKPPPSAWEGFKRPWLYATDPTAPPPGHVLASLGAGYAPLDRSGGRPFAANTAHAGVVVSAGAEVGVRSFMSLHAEGLMAGEGSQGGVHGGGMIGASFFPLPKGLPVDLSLSAGYLRELGGGNGMWARASVAGSYKNARFVVTALGTHVFETARDPVDLLLTAGATYAIIPQFHLGVEYTVQDLEGLFDPEEAEGGVRHFLGPVASLEIAKRVRLTAGPAFGLSALSPRVQGRVSASYAF